MNINLIKDHCEHCGAPMYKYWHNLNRPLCRALFELYKNGGRAHIAKIGLTHNQINNFTKLQHWRFVVKIGGGEWEITETGRDFCRNVLQVPFKVQTYRGELVETGRALVKLEDVMPDEYKKVLQYIADREAAGKKEDQINLFSE